MKSIRKYSLLIDLLEGRKSVSFQEMKECLREYGEVSDRTIERHIQELRYTFGVEISCDRATHLYSINKEESIGLDALLRFIHLFNSSELLLNCIKGKNKALSYLAFESNNPKGSANLEPIYSAIVQSKVIAFDHENYTKDRISRHTIEPYLLKEYNAKWYVVGIFSDSGAVRIFGLDRISHVSVTSETFQKTEQDRICNLFDNLIGLVYDIEKPVMVKLAASPLLSRYLKGTPLHFSQKIEQETEKEVVFSYYLIPNRELQRLILGYGSQLKVVHPQWFADQIREEIRNMSALYEKSNIH
ncbi:MAG: WYL domain-containing protein [Tannerellaceae bacterium]|jgi:predicted DNA-binding transcriptional regulator YafY|nr:WYL domain-containing protein [Tannerellaceae bacterium]